MKKIIIKFFNFFLHNENTLSRVLILSIVLVSPALISGFFSDDIYFLNRLSGNTIMPAKPEFTLYGLFSITPGGEQVKNEMVNQGLLPWWTSNNFRFQMWRPLAELSHAIDFKLFGSFAFPMHIENIMWWCAILWLAYSIYSKLFRLNPTLASICFIFYALDGSYAQTISWIASRNTLMAMFFSLASLLNFINGAHRSQLLSKYWIFASVLYAIGLSCSEFSIGILPFILLYPFMTPEHSLFKKAVSVIPFILFTLAWVYIYKTYHYGVSGSEHYLDPTSDPIKFMSSLLELLPTFVFKQFFVFQPQLLGAYTFLNWNWLLSILILGIIGYCTKEYLSSKLGIYLTVAAIIAIIPISASTGGPRLIGFVSLGLTPILAVIALKLINETKSIVVMYSGGMLLLLHVLSLLAFPLIPVLMMRNAINLIEKPARTLTFVPDKEVILINPYQVAFSALFPIERANKGDYLPPHLYTLMTGDKKIRVIKRDDKTYDFVPETIVLSAPEDFFFRTKKEAFYDNEEFNYPTILISVHTNKLNEAEYLTLKLLKDAAEYQFVYCHDSNWGTLDLTKQKIGESTELGLCSMN